MDGKSFVVVWELFCSWVAEISEQLNIPGSVFVLFGFALMVLGCLDALLLFLQEAPSDSCFIVLRELVGLRLGSCCITARSLFRFFWCFLSRAF